MQDQFFSIFMGGPLLEARFLGKFARKISIFGIQTGEWASNRDFTILPLFLTSPLGPSNACKMILNVLKHIVRVIQICFQVSHISFSLVFSIHVAWNNHLIQPYEIITLHIAFSKLYAQSCKCILI